MTRQRSFFLVVSGNRCGSTWLELGLSALPDVSADLEMQWAETVPTPLHVAMRGPAFDLRSFLKNLGPDSPVVGSKIVLPSQYDIAHIDDLPKALPADIRIVHLTRRYLDSFLSLERRGGHLRNPEGAGGSHPWLRDRFPEEALTFGRTIEFDLARAEADFQRRLYHDRLIARLDDGRRPYMLVDYSEVRHAFLQIARFVGSRASRNEIESVVDNPPTRKLPPSPSHAAIAESGELAQLAERFEGMRRLLFQANSRRHPGRNNFGRVASTTGAA